MTPGRIKDERGRCLRIIDANFNRAVEGLRVCEDIVRFALDRGGEQKGFKKVRHDVCGVMKDIMTRYEPILYRNSGKDVGKGTGRSDLKRAGLTGCFLANSQRVKEALRALEESAKLLDPSWSEKFKLARFRYYSLEKKMYMALRLCGKHERCKKNDTGRTCGKKKS